MQIAEPERLDEFLAGVGEAGARLVAHPGGADCREALERLARGEPVTLAVGPEGGFTPDEIDAAQARGWSTVDLGSRVLRVETAALALASLVAARIGPRGS
jgi:16S rRNA (uracil1498-N3)-methyltransferase